MSRLCDQPSRVKAAALLADPAGYWARVRAERLAELKHLGCASMSVAHEGFHATDGWYFQRQSDGSVRISAAVQRCAEAITLDADTWASVVASVSAEGETAARFQQAHSFHTPDATMPRR